MNITSRDILTYGEAMEKNVSSIDYLQYLSKMWDELSPEEERELRVFFLQQLNIARTTIDYYLEKVGLKEELNQSNKLCEKIGHTIPSVQDHCCKVCNYKLI